jgi:NAD(P)-dependent dehydrogenase (short-subunit alcohol dehydrogenase family)
MSAGEAESQSAPVDLTGRLAVVMGAAGALGGAIALALARAGADVVATTATSEAEEALAVRRTARAVAALGRKSHELMTDMSIGTNVQIAVRQISKDFGAPAICVAAPDFFFARPTDRTSDADWARVVGFNLGGVFFAFRAVAREMMSRPPSEIGIRGHLIAVAGISESGGSAYVSAKQAVPHLVEALAAEWAPNGIRISCIAPTWPALEPGLPLVAEVAALAVQLASDAGMETGKTHRLREERQ